MTDPRIAPLNPPYPPEIAERFASIMPAGAPPLKLFRTLARNPRVMHRLLGGGLLDRGSIGLNEREIVILRSCGRCGSEYEWGVHVKIFAAAARLSERQYRDLTMPHVEDDIWSDAQKSLIRLVDELHERADISDSLWALLRKHWTEEQLVELVVLAGYYHLISFVTNAFRVELEADGARFPPEVMMPANPGA